MQFDPIYHFDDAEQRCNSPHTGEADVSNFKMISNICQCPGLKEALKAFNGDTSLIKCFIGHLSTAASNARAEDTSSCRKATAEYILPSDHMDADVVDKKSNRGWNNHYTARLLCPLKYRSEFDEDRELFMGNVLDGTIKLKASQWPSFLYPDHAVYNPECIDEGLFRGERMMQFLRNICTGPTSAHDGIRRASKPSKAEIHGMDCVFGRCVAYAAVQAYFSLSAIEQWSSSPQEGCFNLCDFFNRCVKLFESDPTDPWVEDTLSFLTDELPSLNREYNQKRKRNISSTSSDESDEDKTKAIYDQREVRRLERIASNASTNGIQGTLGLDAAANATNTPYSSPHPPSPHPPSPHPPSPLRPPSPLPLDSPPLPVSTHRQTRTGSRAAAQPVISTPESSDLSEEDEASSPSPPTLIKKQKI